MNGARRVFHAVPVVFKGSGFYVNDYGKGASTDTSGDSPSGKKDEAGKAGDSVSEVGSASKPGSESSSESKPQVGSETAAAASKSG